MPQLTCIRGDCSVFHELFWEKPQFPFSAENPHNHCNFAAFTSVRPFAGEEPVGQPHHLEWLQHHLPLYATTFIEDHDPEWRDLVVSRIFERNN